MFLLVGLPLTTTAILVYRSDPWKNPFYRNIVFAIMLALNIVIMTVFYAGNNMITGLFGTVSLPLIKCLILFIISASSQILAFLFNSFIVRQFHSEVNLV